MSEEKTPIDTELIGEKIVEVLHTIYDLWIYTNWGLSMMCLSTKIAM